MDLQDIANYRLVNQQIVRATSATPQEVVSSLGAIQAQDYNGSLWAIGLRLKSATQADVLEAIRRRAIVRTWPMRGTLHFVSPGDVRWILSLYGEQKIMKYHRFFGINESVLRRSKEAIIKAFDGQKVIKRKELHDALKRSNIPAMKNNMARSHIMRRVAREGLICFGPHEGKQATFVLLDNWITDKKQLKREDAIAMLARRYFTSHGPATVKDFAWWSGLGLTEARKSTDAVAQYLQNESFGNETYFMPKKIPKLKTSTQAAYLLPAFDEYIVAYKDRSAVLDPKYKNRVIAGSTLIFLPTVVFDGQVMGTWKRTVKGKTVEIWLKPFTRLDAVHKEAVGSAAERYSEFIENPVVLK